MVNLIRPPPTASRATYQLLKTASLPQKFAQRPSSLPRPLFAYAQSRRYASKTPKRGRPSGAPKGMEQLYSPNSALSGSPKKPDNQSGPKFSLKPGRQRLSPDEQKMVDEAFVYLKSHMSPPLDAELDGVAEDIKQHGIQADIWENIKEDINKGSVAARAAKKFRLITQVAREMAIQKVEAEGRRPEQQDSEKPEGKSQTSSNKQQSQKNDASGKGFDFSTSIVFGLISYLLWQTFVPGEASREITWQEFQNTFLDKGLVEKLVVVNRSRVRVHLHREQVASIYPESPAQHPGFYYYFSIGSVEAFERRADEAQDHLGISAAHRIPISYHDEGSWLGTLLAFGPPLVLVGSIYYMTRRAASGGGGGQSSIFSMGRSKAKKFNHETAVKVKFADVAGMDEAKLEIMEFVSFLKEPGIYQKLGAKIPRGAILSGPPGTGKTLLAKATAGESGVPFFSVSGSEFVEMFVGVGPSRVRDLFHNARKNTPCIIFIDEIDAIGKARSKSSFGGGNDEREATLNQILTEMDGFNTSEQVVVLAGTNRADVLDPALMRPGRFDRHITIDRPSMEGRKQIFAVHLKKIVSDEDMPYLRGRLSALTPGFSGADIANCVNEAALIAARAKCESVKMIHFEQAIERVIGGLEKKSLVLSPEEKKTVSYHEAGHAICGWYFQYADPLLKVSIIPRGSGALGYAQYLPGGGNDSVLLNMRQMMDRMAMTLGGRVSEELHFDTVTSGASDDFNKVTRMATAMVTKWGMSKKIGYMYYPSPDESQEAQLQKPFSENTAREIDAEVKRIVMEAYDQCRKLLMEKKKEVGLVAEELLSKEVLDRDDMVRILGLRPWESKGDFDKYFGGGRPGVHGNGGGLL